MNALKGLGRCNEYEKNYSQALKHFLKAKQLAIKLRGSSAKIKLNIEIIDVYMKIQEYDKCEVVIIESIDDCKNNSAYKFELSEFYRRLGQLYYLKSPKDPNKSIFYLNKALETDTMNKNFIDLDFFYSYQYLNQFEKSYMHLKKYLNKVDIFYENLEKNNIEDIETKYQTKLRESENQKLKLQTKNDKKQRSYLIAGIIGLLLLSGGGFYVFKAKRDAELSKKETEIAQLNIQMTHKVLDAHYINGILYTMGSSVLKVSREAYTIFINLTDILKSRLKNNFITTIEQQLKDLERYIALERSNHGEKLQFEIKCDKDCEEISLPDFTIQNLVKNAIDHGLSPKQYKGKVSVSIYKDYQNLFVVVEDDGVGINNSETSNAKIGLSTLTHFFDTFNDLNSKESVITMTDKSDLNKGETGTIASVTIPLDYKFTAE